AADYADLRLFVPASELGGGTIPEKHRGGRGQGADRGRRERGGRGGGRDRPHDRGGGRGRDGRSPRGGGRDRDRGRRRSSAAKIPDDCVPRISIKNRRQKDKTLPRDSSATR